MARSKKKAAPLTPREIVERLAELYGRPVWRPHKDGMSELVLTVLSQNTSDTNSGRAFMRLVARYPTGGELMEAPPGQSARGGSQSPPPPPGTRPPAAPTPTSDRIARR